MGGFRTGITHGLECVPDCRVIGVFAKFLFLAQTNQQDALAAGAGRCMQQQAGAGFARKVTLRDDALDQFADFPVDGGCGRCELAGFKNTDDDACVLRFVRTIAFYAKFHRLTPLADGFLGLFPCLMPGEVSGAKLR